jgi:hypothetical protein
MTPTRRTLLIAALVLLSLFSIVFGFLGAWQIASTGRVPAALSHSDDSPTSVGATILLGALPAGGRSDSGFPSNGPMHAFLTTDLSTPLGQQLANRAIEAVRSEAEANGWSIAVAVVDAKGDPVAVAGIGAATRTPGPHLMLTTFADRGLRRP